MTKDTQNAKSNKAVNLNRVYTILSNVNQLIIHSKDTEKLLDETCSIAINYGGFILAWIGVKDEKTKMIKLIAKDGKAKEYTKNINVSTEKQDTPDSPSGIAFRERKYSVCNDIAKSEYSRQFKENCEKNGIKSSAAFPLNLENGREAVFSLASSETGFFNEAEINLFNELSDDITYAFKFHDTERKRRENEEKLIASELKYRRLFESAKDGIIILDAETGMIVDVNPFLVKLLGFSHEEFLGKTIWDIGFFKDNIANEDKFLELQTKGYVRYEDLPLETAGGQKRNVEFVSNVYLVNNHKVIQCNIRDITERKRAEEAIQVSEKRYQTFINSTPDFVFLKDNKYKHIVANKSLCRFYNKTENEIIGKTDFELMPEPFAAKCKLSDEKTISTNSIIVTEEKWDDKTFETVKFPVEYLKGQIGVGGFVKVITERKKAEEALRESENKYRLLFDNASESIMIAQDGMLKFANPQLSELVKYSNEELLSRPFTEFIVPEDREIVVENYQKRIKGEHIPSNYQFRVLRKDKTFRWVIISSVSCEWQGKPATLNFLTDISDIKRAEKELVSCQNNFVV